MRPITLIVLLALALVARPAEGHEFWIEPDRLTCVAPAPIRVRLFHGERFAGRVVPRDHGMIDRFEMVGPDGAKPVVGRDGGGTSFVRVERPGTHVVGYRTRRYRNQLDAAAFEAYLVEEGLAHIVARRRERGEQTVPGREVYTRCAKSIVVSAGDPNAGAPAAVGGHDHVLGFPLELVPVDSPAARRTGETMTVRAIYDGKPLARTRVVAVNRRAPDALIELSTDERGEVRLPLERAGVWMVTTIHMVEAPRETGADWESFWASLTFEID